MSRNKTLKNRNIHITPDIQWYFNDISKIVQYSAKLVFVLLYHVWFRVLPKNSVRWWGDYISTVRLQENVWVNFERQLRLDLWCFSFCWILEAGCWRYGGGGQKHEWIETVSNHDLIQWHHPTKFPYMQRCALWNSAPKRTLDVLGIYIWFQDNFILVFKDLRYRTKGLGEFVVISPEVECFLKGFGGFLRILGKKPQIRTKYIFCTYRVRTTNPTRTKTVFCP